MWSETGECVSCGQQLFNVHASELTLVDATTLGQGAASSGLCVPRIFSVSPSFSDVMLDPGRPNDFANRTSIKNLEKCVAGCLPGSVCIAGWLKGTEDCRIATYPAAGTLGASAAALPTVHVRVPSMDDGSDATPPPYRNQVPWKPALSQQFVAFYSPHTWDNAPSSDHPDLTALVPKNGMAADVDAALEPCRTACFGTLGCVAFVYNPAVGNCSFKAPSIDTWVGWEAAVVLTA
jgi:hypothetical protein